MPRSLDHLRPRARLSDLEPPDPATRRTPPIPSSQEGARNCHSGMLEIAAEPARKGRIDLDARAQPAGGRRGPGMTKGMGHDYANYLFLLESSTR